MLRPLLVLLAALPLLGACTTPPSPAPAPPPPPAGEQASAPAPAVEEMPGGRSCTTDAQCPRGQVCGRCGDEPGACVPGCHNNSQCPPGQKCREVQCIRCPCPGQCE